MAGLCFVRIWLSARKSIACCSAGRCARFPRRRRRNPAAPQNRKASSLVAGYRGADGTHAYNWFDPWYATDAPRDYASHGSQTLSSAVGSNGVGVAPGATWFACSNLARNMGNPARYLDCMQCMLAPHAPNSDPFTSGDPARAAHVVNNSWGCPPEQGCDAAALLPAVQALRSAGIFSVAGAGNAGDQCSSVTDPLPIYAEVIAVDAIDADGVIAPFSSRGPVTVDGSGRTKPDLVAPGVAIISAAPDGTYSSGSGTSMAGPHIAGVIALDAPAPKPRRRRKVAA